MLCFVSQGFLALAFASSYESQCETAKKFSRDPNPQFRRSVQDWAKERIQELGYTDYLQQPHSLALELGTKPFGVLVTVNSNSCSEVARLLTTLKSIKENDGLAKVNKIVFVLHDFEEKELEIKSRLKTKVFFKEYTLSEVKGTPWIDADQKPATVLGDHVKSFARDFDALKVELKRFVGTEQVQGFDQQFKKLLADSKTWSAEKIIDFQNNVFKSAEFNQNLRVKISDLKKQIVLYDQVRRGLWNQAEQTLKELQLPSEKLKIEMTKGKANIEDILKTIRADVRTTEVEIKNRFEKTRKYIESSSAPASTNAL